MTRLGIGEEIEQRVFRKREFSSCSGVKESAKEQEKIVAVCVGRWKYFVKKSVCGIHVMVERAHDPKRKKLRANEEDVYWCKRKHANATPTDLSSSHRNN